MEHSARLGYGIAEPSRSRYTNAVSLPTFNLTALSDRLFRERRHLKLAGLIRDAVRHHSVRTDLMIAQKSCEALDALRAEPMGGPHLSTIELSLLHNAIMHYARALKTVSDDRKPVDILHILTPEQRAVHDEITDLRDDAVAHFGEGGSYGGIWKAELCLFQIREDGAGKVGTSSRRIALDRALIRRIADQVAVALAYVDPLALAKIEAITAEIDVIGPTDPNFALEIGKHPLNLEIYLASTDAADAARTTTERYVRGVSGHL